MLLFFFKDIFYYLCVCLCDYACTCDESLILPDFLLPGPIHKNVTELGGVALA